MRIQLISCAALLLLLTTCHAAGFGACTSRQPLQLDILSSRRVAGINEKLTYDSLWFGSVDSMVKLRVNDADFAEGIGVGDMTWEPHRPGNYTITATTYKNNVIVGDVLSAEFEVVGRDLVNATISFPDGSPLYDGTPRTPRVHVVYQGETLVEGQDYTVSYEDNVSGVGRAIITGMGRFNDEVEQTFKIQPAGICSLDICSGIRTANLPERIAYDENWFSSTGAGYVRIMENGSRVAQVNGCGEYAWNANEGGIYELQHRTYINGYLQDDKTYTAYFGIPGGPLGNWELTASLEHEVYVYDGQPKTPRVTVSTVLGELVEGTDFSVEYHNNVAPGTATAVISGIGIYSGTLSRTFRIVEAMSGAITHVRQRYPWNGYVDIDLSLSGDSGKSYPTTFTAYDTIGGTNIALNALAIEGGSDTNKTQALGPGTWRLVWNADIDLPNEYVNTGIVLRASMADYGTIPVGAGDTPCDFQSDVVPLDIQSYPVTFTQQKVDLTSRNITYGFESGKNWTKDTSNKKTGSFSYKSYKIGNSASTYLTATVKGKGTFSFWWKVSSESNYDYLRYYVNGTEKAKISGSTSWAQISIPVTSTGNTVIKWTYSKDSSTSSGSDCGWVDATWTPTEVYRYDTITNMPSSWTKFIPKEQWMPTRTMAKDEGISYSTKWAGDIGDEAKAIVSVDGTDWLERSGEGVETWRPDSLGTHVLKHTVREGGNAVGHDFRAKFVVEDLSGDVNGDPPSLKNVSAKPRYPWNGLVDVKCELEGDLTDYTVSLKVNDETGGTNLPARTFWQIGGTMTNQTLAVRPGKLHFVWDANADIMGDGEFPAVSVTLSAGAATSPTHSSSMVIEVAGYQGSETLTNVPVLVRLGPEAGGFSYSGMAYPSTGADLRFLDWEEKEVLPYEIDEWNPDGESLVWVRLPELKAGTKFRLLYGGTAMSSTNRITHRMGYRGDAVWGEYAGVWHMNEDSGTAFDSTAHGLDALPDKDVGKQGDISQMVAYENGACGRARVCVPTEGLVMRYVVPSYDALHLGCEFVAGGWYQANQVIGYPKLFYRDSSDWSDGGWGAELRNGSPTSVNIVGGDNSKIIMGAAAPNLIGNWVNYIFAYDGTTALFYTNGVFAASGEIIAPRDNGLPLQIGQLIGQCDEIRLRGGSLSADRIKADYDMIKNRKFLLYNGQFLPDPPPVVLSAPNVLENSREIDCLDLVWDPVPGATAYEIWVSATQYGSLDGATKNKTITQTSILDDNHAFGGPRYNIWIRAVDDDGHSSDFTGPFNIGNAPS